MHTDFVFYNTFSNRSFFELLQGSRPWNVFLLIYEGSFRFTINDEEHIIGKDEIAFFPYDTLFSRQIIEPISFHQMGFYADTAHPFYAQLRPGRLQIPKEHVRTITENLDIISKLPDNHEMISRITENIILENYINHHKADQSNRIFSQDILTVIQYMNDHLSEKIEMDQLAELVHLSHVGLLWKFKHSTGTTLTEYLTGLRMKYAKELLLAGNLPVSQVADLCGYSNPYYFSNGAQISKVP